jgi:hypothetical protein
MKQKKDFVDPFLRTTDGIEAKNGLSAFDVLTRTPGVIIGRSYELVSDSEQKNLPKYETHFLATGAAVAIDEQEKVVNFWPGRGRFAGFLVGQSRDRATVQTRGSVFLRIAGVQEKDRGRKVYCNSPNSFSLEPLSLNDAEIGIVRFWESENYVAVAFKSENDTRPLDLKY